MGRGYLLGLLAFILTILKKVSTLDQNYHILIKSGFGKNQGDYQKL